MTVNLPKCRTCQIRVCEAGEVRCDRCWRDRAIYLETLLIRTHEQLIDLARDLREDGKALAADAGQRYVSLPLTGMDIPKGGSARV